MLGDTVTTAIESGNFEGRSTETFPKGFKQGKYAWDKCVVS